MDAVLGFLLDNFPWVAVFAIALVAVAFAAWKAAAFYHKQKKVNERVESLPCEKHEGRISELSGIGEAMTSIEDTIGEMARWIMKKDSSTIDTLAKKKSPRVMTSLGKALFEESPARKTMDDNMDKFISELKEKNPATPYDVEEAAMNTLLFSMKDESFNEIKNYLYYSPETVELEDPETGERKEVKVSMSALITLMSIYLRDEYLKRNPSITSGIKEASE